MENKDKNFVKRTGKPYFVWLLIICAVVFLASLPRGAGKAQELDVRKLMTAAETDSLVSMNIRNDQNAGKDWYVIDGKIKNPVFGIEGAPADAPRTLPFTFSGRITDDMYKKLSDPSAPWEIKEIPASTFWGNLFSSVFPILLIGGIFYFLFIHFYLIY